MLLFSCQVVSKFVTLWAVSHQTPQFMGFSKQEYWSGLPFPSPGHLPKAGIEPGSPAFHENSLLSHPLSYQATAGCYLNCLPLWGKEGLQFAVIALLPARPLLVALSAPRLFCSDSSGSQASLCLHPRQMLLILVLDRQLPGEPCFAIYFSQVSLHQNITCEKLSSGVCVGFLELRHRSCLIQAVGNFIQKGILSCSLHFPLGESGFS